MGVELFELHGRHMVWPLSRLTTPCRAANEYKSNGGGDHYEDLLRFYMAIYFPALMSDWPQTSHHADGLVNVPHHLDAARLLAQLLTFS
jgi:hypothetical protein